MNWGKEATPDDDCDGCNMMKVLSQMNEKLKKNQRENSRPTQSNAHSHTESEHTGPSNENTNTNEGPLDLNQLGNSTWGLLHTMAAYYPTQPSEDRQRVTRTFLETLGDVFPCHVCGDDWKRILRLSPPKVGSQHDFSQWLCWAHNDINVQLGKPVFPCETVDQRWRANIFEVNEKEKESNYS